MRYRLIATDIDGTLLNEHHEVTPRARGAIAELQRRGALVVLSTARPPRAVTPLYRELALSGPVIAYNGAMAYDPGRKTALFHHPIPKPLALQVLETIRTLAPELNVGLELADEWHVDRIDERLDASLRAGRIAIPPLTGNLEAKIASTPRGVSKIYFIAPPEVRAAAESRFATAGLAASLAITSSGSAFVEILAAGVSKGAALQSLASALGIPREQTLALGDEENDVPALQAAGLGIAMGNAPAAVKAAAGAIAGPNTMEGWAEAIRDYVLSDAG